MEKRSSNSYSDNIEEMFDQFIPILEFIFGKKLPEAQRTVNGYKLPGKEVCL